MVFAPVLVSSEGNIISPVLFRKRMGYSPKQITYGENSLAKLSPVNSGLCVSLSLFSCVGGYNEAIPLDYSDYDFIDRIKLKTTIFFIIELRLQHELSASETPSLVSSLTRFRFLCIGLKQSSKSRSDVFFSLVVGLKRAVKLTVVYKNIRFFKILFDEFH
ncbi:hypothetical protein [Pedobacter sp. P26]|uniref:hypothetical protein n=1 Tax=Pedobacter sp. P26 TaxID=3423956 RepID=UPI003D677A7B